MLHQKLNQYWHNISTIIISENVTFLLKYLPVIYDKEVFKMLNDNERKKYETIDKVINGKMTRKEAMDELNLSRQQIYRLICLYHSKGKDGFAYGNRGRTNPNKKMTV